MQVYMLQLGTPYRRTNHFINMYSDYAMIIVAPIYILTKTVITRSETGIGEVRNELAFIETIYVSRSTHVSIFSSTLGDKIPTQYTRLPFLQCKQHPCRSLENIDRDKYYLVGRAWPKIMLASPQKDQIAFSI